MAGARGVSVCSPTSPARVSVQLGEVSFLPSCPGPRWAPSQHTCAAVQRRTSLEAQTRRDVGVPITDTPLEQSEPSPDSTPAP